MDRYGPCWRGVQIGRTDSDKTTTHTCSVWLSFAWAYLHVTPSIILHIYCVTRCRRVNYGCDDCLLAPPLSSLVSLAQTSPRR